jgi:hypothetical protein
MVALSLRWEQRRKGAMIAALKASDRRNGVGDWRRVREVSSRSLGVPVEIDPPGGVGEIKARGDLNRLLALLVAVACGVSAGATVNHAPVYADDSGDGY